MRLRCFGLALLLGGAAAVAQSGPQPQDPQSAPPPPQAQQMRQQVQQLQQRLQQMQQRMQMMQQVQQRRQGQQGQGGQQGQQGRGGQQGQQGQPQGRPPLERMLGGPPGKWWDRPELVQRLVLTADQQTKIDEVFQQSRLRLIDLNATLEKETLTMDPLVSAQQPDEAKIVAQIDKVAQARAELEKANARMLLGIRRVLTQDQWNRLKAETGTPLPAQAGGRGRQQQPPPNAPARRNPQPARPPQR